MRNAINPPRNRITQGTIFSCVVSPYESGKGCYGISITARCDTVRDFKAASLTFLPIVTMEDWLWYECLPKCTKDQIKSAQSKLRIYLRKKYDTSVILDTFGFDAAVEFIKDNNKELQNIKETYQDAQVSKNMLPYSWSKLPDSIAKSLNARATELLAGKIQNFYFIDEIEPNFGMSVSGRKYGYVVILRDIRTISRELALLIPNGIDSVKFTTILKKNSTAFQLKIDDEDFCMPIGELTSPFVEQLLQNFSLLFGRIGTKDVPAIYYEEIENLLRR